MTPEEFRSHGHALIDLITEYLEGIEQRPVSALVKPGEVRAGLPEHPPAAPEPFERVLDDLRGIVIPGLTHWQHPQFFAYFPANITYASILGELAAAGFGVQGMSWITSPACTEVETLMLDWMQELLALPERFRSTDHTGGGVIQGSASEATLVAILSARWRSTGGRVNADGDTSRLVAYATSQAHSSIEKGLRIAGIGTERIRTVAHDASFAMRPDALAEAIAADKNAGLVPFFVCATHGTTSSMAFDPTPEIGDICRANDVWLHVDGAMSGIAALVRRDDRFEIVAPHPLNLLCVSLVAGDAATDDLIERANATGEVLFTRTVLDGRSVLRFSIGGRTTEQRHVLAGWNLLLCLIEPAHPTPEG